MKYYGDSKSVKIPEEYGDAEYKLGRLAEKIGRENILNLSHAADAKDVYVLTEPKYTGCSDSVIIAACFKIIII